MQDERDQARRGVDHALAALGQRRHDAVALLVLHEHIAQLVTDDLARIEHGARRSPGS